MDNKEVGLSILVKIEEFYLGLGRATARKYFLAELDRFMKKEGIENYTIVGLDIHEKYGLDRKSYVVPDSEGNLKYQEYVVYKVKAYLDY